MLVARVQLLVRIAAVGRKNGELRSEYFITVHIGKVFAELRDVLPDFRDFCSVLHFDSYLLRKRGCRAGAEIDGSAVHAGAGEVAGDVTLHGSSENDVAVDCRGRIKIQHDNRAACLVFAEKASRLAADNDSRLLRLVCLHVDACAVSCVAADVDGTAAHGVAGGIACVAVHDDFAAVHRVACRVLHVSFNRDCRAVEVCAERVAGRSVDFYSASCEPCADIALADSMRDAYVFFLGVAYLFIKNIKSELRCRVYFKHGISPYCTAKFQLVAGTSSLAERILSRFCLLNASSCGSSFMASKSMVESGTLSRMIDV